ncbi:conserved Plasmodium protein, unknown function [Plasmodium ovale]|uniref:Uncharacterized protein n=2 Tax=Plasmodium ovale TaxID=36330 RepID=A0A1A8WCX1_PLAOA|nr:conserved Plasmodium protein, unknown function [Plasmodium ovale curtisi]SBS91425.1 conserved Plasmodium protein, unknown function [Plasmodium ovale curtisi]SCP04625.1 conserved Plasmodium protein, unknown function [Plasmodium ovale]
MSSNLKNCINWYFHRKNNWTFYINLRDVTDLKELDELLCEEENCYYSNGYEHKKAKTTQGSNSTNVANSANDANGAKGQGEKILLGEIIKAYIFCKSAKIKETCNLCLMSWISTRQCWFDCDQLLLNKYFKGLLEPLIFICKVLKEKVAYHFYQIPKRLYIVFIKKFKKYLRIYKDKEVILNLISSASELFHSKMLYSQC